MTSGHRFRFLACVDRSPQSRVAARFAALRARAVSGIVSLLHVVDPPEFQTLMSIAEAMEEEQRTEAEQLLHSVAADVYRISGLVSELHIRTGAIGEEILALLAEQPDIDVLVVGAAPPAQRRGRLISWLTGQLAGSIEIPLVVVPGNLTDEQLARHT